MTIIKCKDQKMYPFRLKNVVESSVYSGIIGDLPIIVGVT